jgi:hypothetical protein
VSFHLRRGCSDFLPFGSTAEFFGDVFKREGLTWGAGFLGKPLLDWRRVLLEILVRMEEEELLVKLLERSERSTSTTCHWKANTPSSA